MKTLSKIKFIVIVVNLALVFCGFCFLGGFFSKKAPVECKTAEAITKEQEEQKNIVEDFTHCQSELFLAKNQIEKLKVMPDVRKDVIELLILARDIEKNIGIRRNFSNECVRLFALSARIPVIQEYVLKYKEPMFKTNCRYSNNADIVSLIAPFQVKFLEKKREQENEQADEKLYRRFWNGIKFYVSRLFVSSNIKKSELEINVENGNYQEAVDYLNSGDFEKNDEFNQLYSAVVDLKNLKQLVNEIFGLVGEEVVAGGESFNYDGKKK